MSAGAVRSGGNVDCLKLLIAGGAELDSKRHASLLSWHCAAVTRNVVPPLRRIVLPASCCAGSHRAGSHCAAFMYALTCWRQPSRLSTLHRCGGVDVVYIAAYSGHLPVLAELVAAGCSIESVDDHGVLTASKHRLGRLVKQTQHSCCSKPVAHVADLWVHA